MAEVRINRSEIMVDGHVQCSKCGSVYLASFHVPSGMLRYLTCKVCGETDSTNIIELKDVKLVSNYQM
jgi:transcription elongation factor Elf1